MGPTTLLTRYAEELRRVQGIKGLSPDKSPDRVGAGTGRRRGMEGVKGDYGVKGLSPDRSTGRRRGMEGVKGLGESDFECWIFDLGPYFAQSR